MDYFNAFWVGGLICALVQILMEKTKLLPGRIMVLLVCTGAVISFFGWYEPFMEYAGAGASVPLLGYGNILMKGVKEAISESGFIGLFQGGFKTGAVGCCAALVFGYLASLVFKPKMKAEAVSRATGFCTKIQCTARCRMQSRQISKPSAYYFCSVRKSYCDINSL